MSAAIGGLVFMATVSHLSRFTFNSASAQLPTLLPWLVLPGASVTCGFARYRGSLARRLPSIYAIACGIAGVLIAAFLVAVAMLPLLLLR